MEPGDADLARRAIGHVERDPAMPDHRLQILRDLIAGRQVRIKIILTIEHALKVDLGLETEPGLDRLLDTNAIDDRQHAREPASIGETWVLGSAPKSVAAPENS